MRRKAILCLVMSTLLMVIVCHGQSGIDSRFVDRVTASITSLNKRFDDESDKYLRSLSGQERHIRQRLYKVDSVAAIQLFPDSGYIRKHTRSALTAPSGEYQPYLDSLRVTLLYFQQNPRAAKALSLLQTLQAKLKETDDIKAYVKSRQLQIADYIRQHPDLGNLIGKPLQAMSRDACYYSQTVKAFKEDLNTPGKLEAAVLSRLSALPAFQAFMNTHSQLAALFGLPAGYGSDASLAGLQTRDQVNNLIQGQVSGAGPGGAAALQSNLESAHAAINNLQNKLESNGGNPDMPDFTPNEQKSKTFWRRLEYGVTFQTAKNTYLYPTTTNMGLSAGYKLNSTSVIGIGIEYRLGWGSGIDHVRFSNQGLCLRSFIDIKIKGSFYGSGGFEYNHAEPFQSVQALRHVDEWSRSGLIGISKVMSIKSRVFKKTKLQLLWDFLSYRQQPQTAPIKFRISYNL